MGFKDQGRTKMPLIILILAMVVLLFSNAVVGGWNGEVKTKEQFASAMNPIKVLDNSNEKLVDNWNAAKAGDRSATFLFGLSLFKVLLFFFFFVALFSALAPGNIVLLLAIIVSLVIFIAIGGIDGFVSIFLNRTSDSMISFTGHITDLRSGGGVNG